MGVGYIIGVVINSAKQPFKAFHVYQFMMNYEAPRSLGAATRLIEKIKIASELNLGKRFREFRFTSYFRDLN